MGCLSISTFIISFIYLYSSLLGILTCLKRECEELEHFKHFRISIIIISKEFKALEPKCNIMWNIIYAPILNHKYLQISLDIFHQILTAISVTSHFAINKKLKEDNCIPRRLCAVLQSYTSLLPIIVMQHTVKFLYSATNTLKTSHTVWTVVATTFIIFIRGSS